ncbi:hypothetical protein M3A96_06915 [Helcobacillus massiliensis]|uniref:SAV-6107-like HEPN domain-containing protein n=1 Tax=Helcobacillus massiliensis TaxID=521392 RepID=A0A839R0G2_9MICO|nr:MULTISPECIES: hypothetical protein [Helcobacillus]MBB3021826.1 hypothetical protein [Helcobacillus massiliensis]MCG7427140.1 hypothetical protein [Helcobacillus sp. ACRRO]MCT1557845.1 hypothetical protein [Helcobacillus massiliensis]MCT2036659.1 hypothetical protein [Helcobacillus massiliensis]MCT2332130.1 hypothetical protein [Helcobacillus massiliensis]
MTITVQSANTWFDACDRIEQQLDRAEQLIGEDRAQAFETCHRAALATAGIMRDRANQERRRPLPLNAWTALSRLGTVHRVRAAEVEPFVQLRARSGPLLESRVDIAESTVREHIAQSRRYLRVVQGELTDELAAAC